MKQNILFWIALIVAMNCFAADKFISQDSNNANPTGSREVLLDNGSGAYDQSTITQILNQKTNLVTAANALDFGADPTGATDSTAAIQAAIDSLGSIGGTCFIPRGTYGITGANTIHMRRNVTLEGEMSTYGGNGTQLSKTGSGACIMLAFTSCTIKNIHLVGQGVGNNQFGIISTNILDTSQSTTNFKLQDVKCEGFDVGFWIHNGWAAEINTCYAQACRDGLLFSNVVDSIRVIGGEYYNCTNGIHLAGGNIYRETIECLMENDVIGLLIEDDVAVDYNYGITVQNCWFEGDPTCIDATDVIQLQVINNTLSANAGGTNMIFRGGNRSSTISGNEIGGGCALHAVGSGVRGMLWENNYDSSTFPIVDSGTTGSVYIGANGLIGGNLELRTGSFYGSGAGLTNMTNVATLSGNNAFTGANSFAGATTLASAQITNAVFIDKIAITNSSASWSLIWVTSNAWNTQVMLTNGNNGWVTSSVSIPFTVLGFNFVFPTNPPVDGQSIVSAGTAGYTKFSTVSGSSQPFNVADTSLSFLKDDFPNQNGISKTIGELGWTLSPIGSAGSGTAVAVANHPGLYGVFTGTVSGDGVVLTLGATNGTINLYPALNASTGWTNTWIFKLSGTNDTIMWMGLVNDLIYPSTEPADWMGLSIDTANANTWTYNCRSSSTSTTASGAVIVNTGTPFHNFQIWSTVSGTISFALDGANLQTINAHVPTTTLTPMAVIKKSNTANSITLTLDYWSGVLTGLTR